MKLPVFDLEKKKTGERVLPPQLMEAYRPDLICRAVLAAQSLRRQAYGAHPGAGIRQSGELSKRRRNYRGSYGLGISRVKRKILSRRGTRMSWVGAITPQTVGGRRAHPPKAEKIFRQKINSKENRKALRSAVTASLDRKIVEERGHQVPEDYPFLIGSSFEGMKKTAEVEKALLSLGFGKELERSRVKKIRAGRARRRGRKYQRRKGLLIVVSQQCPLQKAAQNLPGVEVVPANILNAELLAPGAAPGRATLWTEKALELIEKNSLFK